MNVSHSTDTMDTGYILCGVYDDELEADVNPATITAAAVPVVPPEVSLALTDADGGEVTTANVGQTLTATVGLTAGAEEFALTGGEIALRYDDAVVEPMLFDGSAPGSIADIGGEYEAPESIVNANLTGFTADNIVVAKSNIGASRPAGLVKVAYTGTATITDPADYMQIKFRVKAVGDPAIGFASDVDFPNDAPGETGVALNKATGTWDVKITPAKDVTVNTPEITFTASDFKDSASGSIDSAKGLAAGDTFEVAVTVSKLDAMLEGTVVLGYDAAYFEPVVAVPEATGVDQYVTCGITDWDRVANIDGEMGTGYVVYTVSSKDGTPIAATDSAYELYSLRFKVLEDLADATKTFTVAPGEATYADGYMLHGVTDAAITANITPATVEVASAQRISLYNAGGEMLPFTDGKVVLNVYEGTTALDDPFTVKLENRDGSLLADQGFTLTNADNVGADKLINVTAATGTGSTPGTITISFGSQALASDKETVSFTLESTDGTLTRDVVVNVFKKPVLSIALDKEAYAIDDTVTATVTASGIIVGDTFDSLTFDLAYPAANLTYAAISSKTDGITASASGTGTLKVAITPDTTYTVTGTADTASLTLAEITFTAAAAAENALSLTVSSEEMTLSSLVQPVTVAAIPEFTVSESLGVDYDVYIYPYEGIYRTAESYSLGVQSMRAEIKLKNAQGYLTSTDVDDASNPASYFGKITLTSGDELTVYYAPQRGIFDVLIPQTAIKPEGMTNKGSAFDGKDVDWLDGSLEFTLVAEADRTAADKSANTLMYGDVNYEGYTEQGSSLYTTNGADAALILNYEIGNASVDPNFLADKAKGILAMDVDGDGSTVGADAAIILTLEVGTQDPFDYFNILDIDHFTS